MLKFLKEKVESEVKEFINENGIFWAIYVSCGNYQEVWLCF